MDMYEVTAIGDLQKGSILDFPWNMREFALIGVKLMYYNRKGQKQGEIDISRCKVRKFTPKEDKLPNSYVSTTKFPFLIEGNKKTHILCATSEKNRDLWISIIENQIHEFRSPVRRFIRTGEVVHANGFVKRINMFGKTPILLVVTNFPRIIEIYPATVELKDQYTWDPNSPPTFVKVMNIYVMMVMMLMMNCPHDCRNVSSNCCLYCFYHHLMNHGTTFPLFNSFFCLSISVLRTATATGV